MAIITEVDEEPPQQPATTSAPADRQSIGRLDDFLLPILSSEGPHGLLEIVADFLRRKSDAFKSESSYKELVAVLSIAKDKEDSSSRLAAKKKEDRAKKIPAVAPVQASSSSKEAPAVQASSSAKEAPAVQASSSSKEAPAVQASSSSKEAPAIEKGKLVGKSVEKQVADSDTSNSRGEFSIIRHNCTQFCVESWLLYLIFSLFFVLSTCTYCSMATFVEGGSVWTEMSLFI